MLRITVTRLTNQTVTLLLEGRVAGGLVDEVRETCEGYLVTGHHLTLDLRDLLFADRDAVVFFHELLNRQVTLINCSPFLSMQLEQNGRPRG